jgi:hypothetical protein
MQLKAAGRDAVSGFASAARGRRSWDSAVRLTVNNGMHPTRNQHVSHARLVAGGGSCAPLMPSVMRL